MNIFKKLYCRIYQGFFRLILPFLPYREPQILKKYVEIVGVLKEKGILERIGADKNGYWKVNL